MITDAAIPRTTNGGVQLCHHCQRAIYFAGGYLLLLAKDLENAARLVRIRNKRAATKSVDNDSECPHAH